MATTSPPRRRPHPDDRSAGTRSGPARGRATPSHLRRRRPARRALPGLRGARPGRRQGRGRRLDARRLPDGRPALRRDAREQRAHGRPPRTRVADARAHPPAEAGPDRQGPGRGRPRPAPLPGGRGPGQAARGDVRRPAGRQDEVPQRLPLPHPELGRRRDHRLAGRRGRDRRPAGPARQQLRPVRPDDAQDLLGGVGPHHARARRRGDPRHRQPGPAGDGPGGARPLVGTAHADARSAHAPREGSRPPLADQGQDRSRAAPGVPGRSTCPGSASSG